MNWSDLLISVTIFATGYLFAYLTASLEARRARDDRDRESRDRRLDREAEMASRLEEREESRRRKHLEDQLSWLVELQDVMSDFMRAFGSMEHADLVAIRASGQEKIRLPLLDEELSERANGLQRRAIVLASRIDEEAIRQGVNELMGHLTRYSIHAETTAGELSVRADRVAESFVGNIEAIGAKVRSLGAFPG